MTERIYDNNAYISEFKAEIISCVSNGKNFEVQLNKTAFFPEGGGQPGDKGKIGNANVLDTIERNGEIIHICDSEVSGEVNCELNWDLRFSNMQQHSGEHIFSGFTHKLTGFDNVGFHMGENEVTIDFNGYISPETLAEIERLTNIAICENRKINIIYPTRDELKNYNYRSKKEIEGQVRLVEIEGADLCACCGTHVKLTGEVGLVKVISSMNYKQGVRITLRIGYKALEDYNEKNKSVLAISNSLKAKANEVYEAVEKLKDKLNETHNELNSIKKELFIAKCENVNAAKPYVFYSSSSADDARTLADILADKLKIAYAFSGDDSNGYKYAIVSRTEDLRETGKALNAALNGRGGGKPECIMGTVNATKSEIEKYFE